MHKWARYKWNKEAEFLKHWHQKYTSAALNAHVVAVLCPSHDDFYVDDLFTAYKCRCTRKGPKIRYKDVQKLEIKPKHPFCQEKMILWVTCCIFTRLSLSFCDWPYFSSCSLLLSFFLHPSNPLHAHVLFLNNFLDPLISYHLSLFVSLFSLQNHFLYALSHTYPTLSASTHDEFSITVPGPSGQRRKWHNSKIKITDIYKYIS